MTLSFWDVLILILLLFYFIQGWRRGLAAMALQIFGSLIALFAAIAGAGQWSSFFAERLARPFLAQRLSALGDSASPVYAGTGYLLAFLFTFVLVSVGLHFLARLLRLTEKLPGIGRLNALLGGLLGAMLASALLLLLFYFLQQYAPALFDAYGPFSPAVLSNSYLLPVFAQGNFGDLLRSIYQQIHFISN